MSRHKENAPGATNTRGHKKEQSNVSELYHTSGTLSTPQFVKIPQSIKISDQHTGLLNLYGLCAWALTHPNSTDMLRRVGGLKEWLKRQVRFHSRFEPLWQELRRLYLKGVLNNEDLNRGDGTSFIDNRCLFVD